MTALSRRTTASAVLALALTAGGALAQGTTPLDVWIYDSFAGSGKPIYAFADDFMKANPGIKVNLIPTQVGSSSYRDKFIVAAQAGAGPDVIMSDIAWSPQFASMNLALPVDQELGTLSRQFYPGAVSTLTYKGKLYGLPFYTNALGMIINKDAFKAAGVPVPGSKWTVKEFMNAVDKLSNGRMYGFGYEGGWGGTFEWMPWLWSNKAELLNSGGTASAFASKAGLEATQAFLNLVTNKKYVPEAAKTWKSWDELAAAFATGTIAMYEVGDWGISGIEKFNPKFDWGVVPLPYLKTPSSIVGGANWMINSNTKKADAAIAWVKYASGPKSYALLDGYNRMSARLASEVNQSTVKKDPRMQAFARVLATAKARPSIPNWTQVEYDCLQPAFMNVILKGANSTSELQNAQACADKVLSGK